MTIETPKQSYIPALKTLWQEAFGDSDAFWDMFEKTAFHSDRCRCVTENGDVVAALYWFNCSYHSKQIAYLYALDRDEILEWQWHTDRQFVCYDTNS